MPYSPTGIWTEQKLLDLIKYMIGKEITIR